MKSKEILINKINFDINVTSTDSFEDFEKFIFKTYESNLNSIIQNIIDENKEIDDNILIDEIVIDLKEFNLKEFLYSFFAENLKDQLSRLKLPTKSKDYDFHTSFFKKVTIHGGMTLRFLFLIQKKYCHIKKY